MKYRIKSNNSPAIQGVIPESEEKILYTTLGGDYSRRYIRLRAIIRGNTIFTD